jgi:hypothetical protein
MVTSRECSLSPCHPVVLCQSESRGQHRRGFAFNVLTLVTQHRLARGFDVVEARDRRVVRRVL